MRILLVEDNPEEALMVREQATGVDAAAYGLEQLEFVVAGDLAAALARIRENDIELIVSDLNLPDSEGVATVAALLAAAPSLPLIVLTVIDDRRVGREAVHRGAQDYLSKRLFTGELFVRAVFYAIERQQLHARIARQAVIDELTGLYNRRYCWQELRRLSTMARRYHSPLAIFIADLDYFKDVNDTHGHQAGDAVLRMVTAKMRGALRTVDVFCRYGGDEFVALLPEIGEAGALHTAERVRQVVAAQPCRIGGLTCAITLSIGVAAMRTDDTADTLLARADRALYAAKASGRNRSVFGSSAELPDRPIVPAEAVAGCV